MKLEPRSNHARVSLILWTLTAAFIAFGLAYRNGPGVVLLVLTIGLVLISLVWRPKVAGPADAVASCSATQLSSSDYRWTGQFSVTKTGIVWSPSARAAKHGAAEVAVSAAELSAISLEKAPALLEMIVELTPAIPHAAEPQSATRARRVDLAHELFTASAARAAILGRAPELKCQGVDSPGTGRPFGSTGLAFALRRWSLAGWTPHGFRTENLRGGCRLSQADALADPWAGSTLVAP